MFGIFQDIARGKPTILVETGSLLRIVDGQVDLLETRTECYRPPDLERRIVLLCQVNC